MKSVKVSSIYRFKPGQMVTRVAPAEANGIEDYSWINYKLEFIGIQGDFIVLEDHEDPHISTIKLPLYKYTYGWSEYSHPSLRSEIPKDLSRAVSIMITGRPLTTKHFNTNEQSFSKS